MKNTSPQADALNPFDADIPGISLKPPVEVPLPPAEKPVSASPKKTRQSGKTGLVQNLLDGFLHTTPTPEILLPGQHWYEHMPETGWMLSTPAAIRARVSRYLLGLQGLAFRKVLVDDIMEGLRGRLFAHGSDAHHAFFIRPDEQGNITLEPADGWIPCRDKIIHVPTGETSDFTTALFTPGRVPCAYDPSAQCPRWLQFLEEVAAGEMENLQKMAGLSLTYDRRLNVFFVLHGEGGTGKSTFLNVIQALNTGAWCNISLSDFGEKFQCYDLSTKRVNIVHDMDSIHETGNVSLREARLKSATCGESFQMEQKGVQAESRRAVALNIFACNNFPQFADRSTAIPARMRVIGFHRPFRDTSAQDMNLLAKLLEETPGILNWALEGYRKLIASGVPTFPESDAARTLKAAEIYKNRPEIEFFAEFMVPDVKCQWQPSLEVYELYREFCERRKNKAMKQSNFNTALEKYFGIAPPVQKQENGKRCKVYQGVRLRNDSDNF